ncbi:hypothetical protein HYALB_00009706 [Hymenoscyphus albidus]|uniref:2-dehydropantoate 2-reductase n=1 Tax=Hymenoscyphus albidus TaxID=595503 RepID=A0A9N9LDL2_9HELO|nr:hypothetical protein HYALB_00009706 [Hymenoscyphus albidus]
MSRVLIFGAGGVGSIYAYILLQGGASVTAVCRSNYETVKRDGFTINSAIWGEGIKILPGVVRTVEEAANTDWDYVVLCSKAMPGASPSTAQVIRPVVGTGTTVVLCQNGIHIEDEYRRVFPGNAIVSAVVYLPVTQIAAGLIKHGNLEILEHGNLEILEVGTYPSDAPAEHKDATVRFAELFRKGKGTIDVFDDIQSRRWNKLIVNGTWNPLCALSRSMDIDLLSASENASEMVFKVKMEIVSIAQAHGYKEIQESNARFLMDRVKGRRPDNGVYPSMVADAVEMRPMEVEAIVGGALKAARERGVGTPFLDLIYVLIKALDNSNRRKRAQT